MLQCCADKQSLSILSSEYRLSLRSLLRLGLQPITSANIVTISSRHFLTLNLAMRPRNFPIRIQARARKRGAVVTMPAFVTMPSAQIAIDSAYFLPLGHQRNIRHLLSELIDEGPQTFILRSLGSRAPALEV